MKKEREMLALKEKTIHALLKNVANHLGEELAKDKSRDNANSIAADK